MGVFLCSTKSINQAVNFFYVESTTRHYQWSVVELFGKVFQQLVVNHQVLKRNTVLSIKESKCLGIDQNFSISHFSVVDCILKQQLYIKLKLYLLEHKHKSISVLCKQNRIKKQRN